MPRQSTKKKRPKMSSRTQGLAGLSSCAAHYAMTIADPFNISAVGACVPTFPARLSQKASVRTVGQMNTGHNIGFLAISPTVCNNQPFVWYTDSDHTGGTVNVEPYSLAPGTHAVNQSGAQFTSAEYVDGTINNPSSITSRIVSVGIRIRYTGTELNKGGLVYCLVSPDHGNLNFSDITALNAYKECIKVPVSRKWTEIVISAVDPDETVYPDASDWLATGSSGASNLEYLKMLYPFSQGACCTASAPAVGAPVALIVTTGLRHNTFEWEVITHMEHVGKPVQSLATRSHSDMQGMSDVTGAAGAAGSLRGGTGMSQKESVLSSLAKTMYENKQEIIQSAQIINQLVGSLRGSAPYRTSGYRGIGNG